jgi:hypothetical protein
MRGHCLCGTIKFEIDGSRFKLYQCHCSLCRRQSGSSSNAATIVPAEKFRWLSGAEFISSWTKDTGFRSDFCSHCGSPVPNPLRSMPYVWVPAGLLENGDELEIVSHLFMGSKAPWDSISLEGLHYDAAPDLAEFVTTLSGAIN